jgi:DNA-3-methyladenine glycosylase
MEGSTLTVEEERESGVSAGATLEEPDESPDGLIAGSRRLGRPFFARDTVAVARALLGCVLVTLRGAGMTRGRIVETEAYLGAEDPASHAARLKRGGVLAMGGPPGIAYVYRSYGIHTMLNVVCEPTGRTGAVLIRAVEPLAGLEIMRARRGVEVERALCCGPGRLCRALGVTLADHGRDLVEDATMWLEDGSPPARTWASGRIGISRGTDRPWRFFDPASPFVSSHRRGAPVLEPG